MLETLATKTEATVPGQALHGPVEKLEPKIV
jgi:hypothetical protein